MRQGEEMDGDHTGPLLERMWTSRKRQNKAVHLPEDSKEDIPECEQMEEKDHIKIRKKYDSS